MDEYIMGISMKIKNNKGFTLSELLLVVGIIGVLVAIAIPNFMKQLERSREQSDFALMESARAAAVSAYYKSSSANGVLDAWNKGTSFYYDISTGKVPIDGSLPVGPYGNGTDAKAFTTVSEEYDEVCCDAAYPKSDAGLASTQSCVLSCYLDEAGLMHVHWTPASGMTPVVPSTPTSPVPAPSIPPKPSPSPKPSKEPSPSPVPSPVTSPVPDPEPSEEPSPNTTISSGGDWPVLEEVIKNGQYRCDVTRGDIVHYGGKTYVAVNTESFDLNIYNYSFPGVTGEGEGYTGWCSAHFVCIEDDAVIYTRDNLANDTSFSDISYGYLFKDGTDFWMYKGSGPTWAALPDKNAPEANGNWILINTEGDTRTDWTSKGN